MNGPGQDRDGHGDIHNAEIICQDGEDRGGVFRDAVGIISGVREVRLLGDNSNSHLRRSREQRTIKCPVRMRPPRRSWPAACK